MEKSAFAYPRPVLRNLVFILFSQKISQGILLGIGAINDWDFFKVDSNWREASVVESKNQAQLCV